MPDSYVILAAGRGTRLGRVGEHLHKALVPVGEDSAITRILDRRPVGSKVIVCVGFRAQQIKDFFSVAYPDLPVTFVDVEGWDKPGGGPGASLLQAMPHVTGDMLFTSCDTLVNEDISYVGTWMGVAPMPSGTDPKRWCRVMTNAEGVVTRVLDKTDDSPESILTYIGLGHVRAVDQELFWAGIASGETVGGELQVSAGFAAIRRVETIRFGWIDIGDKEAYEHAVSMLGGYDWVKPDQATYVLTDRVVKYNADKTIIDARQIRGGMLNGYVPKILGRAGNFLACDYAYGRTVYQTLEEDGVTTDLLDAIVEWHRTFPHVLVDKTIAMETARRFYESKTTGRIKQLSASRWIDIGLDAVSRVDFDRLVSQVEPGIFHGDFNFGNIIVARNDDGVSYTLQGIDWREHFAGVQGWGDLRYDRGKLLAGIIVHWDRARRGDFRPWDEARWVFEYLMTHDSYATWDVKIIAALSLINCAPLHAAPLDAVLMARGVAWLNTLTKE